MIYIFCLIFIIVLGVIFNSKNTKSNKNKKIFLILSFFILTFIAAFRSYNVGVDTKQYYHAFIKTIYLDFSNLNLLRYEFGFSLLCKILSNINNNPQILIIVSSIFINFAVAKFIYKNSTNVYISTIMYIVFNFFFAYMNIMRQAIAIAILLIGYEKLKEKKYIKYSLYIFIATLFHGSSVLALLLIPISKMKYNKRNLLIVFISVFLCFIFGKNIFLLIARLSPRLFEYVGGSFDAENYFGALIESSIYFVTFIFGLYCLSANKLKNEYLKFKDNINLNTKIVAMALIISVMVMRVSIFNRFLPLFSIYLIIWIPDFLSCVSNKNRTFYTTLLLIFYIAYFCIVMIYRPEWYGVLPYSFFWEI